MDAIDAKDAEPAVLEVVDERARFGMQRRGAACALEAGEHGRAVLRTKAKACVRGKQVLLVRREPWLCAVGEPDQLSQGQVEQALLRCCAQERLAER